MYVICKLLPRSYYRVTLRSEPSAETNKTAKKMIEEPETCHRRLCSVFRQSETNVHRSLLRQWPLAEFDASRRGTLIIALLWLAHIGQRRSRFSPDIRFNKLDRCFLFPTVEPPTDANFQPDQRGTPRSRLPRDRCSRVLTSCAGMTTVPRTSRIFFLSQSRKHFRSFKYI